MVSVTAPTQPLTRPDPAPAPPRTPVAALLTAGACAGGVWVVQATAVGTALGRRVDQAVMTTAGDAPAVVTRLADTLLDQVSAASVAVVLAALSLVALLRGALRAELAAAAVLLGANVTTQVLKAVLGRPDSAGGSLPSGHVTLTATLVVAALLVVAARWRTTVGLLGGAAVALVAVAVVVAQWHRPSDVVAALLVVGGWTAVACLALRPDRGHRILVAAAPGGP